jgi:hypothetical protein
VASYGWSGKRRYERSPEVLKREALEARLDEEELTLELERLKKEKQEEKKIRDAARAKEDAKR